MGRLGAGREIRQVEGAGVCQLHLVTVGEAGKEGHSGQDDVSSRCIGSQKVAHHSRVEDGASLDGSGIGSSSSWAPPLAVGPSASPT